jgi:ribosomal protein S18 acetylase RimI-like enzyme
MPLGATLDGSSESFAALRALMPEGGFLALVAPEPIATPDGFAVVMAGTFDQMVAASVAPAAGPHIEILGDVDAPEMLALAQPLLPNSLFARSHELGRHIGVRAEGRLVAMAGERLRLTGFTEISSVCTDPDYRGRGYARALVARLGRAILDRGEIPFLHVHSTNHAAIGVYLRLGFAFRRVMHLVTLHRHR